MATANHREQQREGKPHMGFMGMGHMGAGMATRLLDAGIRSPSMTAR